MRVLRYGLLLGKLHFRVKPRAIRALQFHFKLEEANETSKSPGDYSALGNITY
jgi:hypothetical protein